MQKYSNNVTNRGGQSVAGASVSVATLAGAAAALYSDNGVTTRSNPLTTDANGYFEFYAADGRYSLSISGPGINTQQITDIILEDPADGSAALAASGGAGLVGFIQSGTGAVATELQDKGRETVSVLDYLSVAERINVLLRLYTVDISANLQKAVDASSTAGKELILPGVGFLANGVQARANMRLCGTGNTLWLRDAAVAGTPQLWIDSVSDVKVEGIKFDNNNSVAGGGYASIYIKSATAAAAHVEIEGNQFVNGVGRPYIDGSCSIPGKQLEVKKNKFYGNTSGCVRLLNTVDGHVGITIDDNYMEGSGGAVIQLRRVDGAGATLRTYDAYIGVRVANNRMTALAGGTDGPIPLELFSSTNVAVYGNNFDSGTRGVNSSLCKNAAYFGNTISNQTFYFMEMQGCDGIAIYGNTALNCRTFINDTTTVDAGSKNVKIHQNLYKGSGMAAYDATANVIFMNSAASSGYENWTIHANIFVDPRYNNAFIRVDHAGTKNVDVGDNMFVAADETVPNQVIAVRAGSNVRVKRNTLVRTANVTANTMSGTGTQAFIRLSTGAGIDDIEVEANRIVFTGTDTRGAPGVIGIGENSVAAALTNLKVNRNIIVGNTTSPLLLNVNSGDTEVLDNDTRRAVGANTILAAIVRRRTRAVTEGLVAPTTGTWESGDIAWNTAPNGAAGVAGWMCTAAGTPGTWDVIATVGQQKGISTVGDASVTLTSTTSRGQQVFSTALTANRTVTLSTTNAWNGSTFRVVRTATATGAFNLDVGGLKTLAAGQWAEVTYNGAAWVLTASGTL